ncbi:hypothetical protein Tco_0332285 [Tanacetum coccineum]
MPCDALMPLSKFASTLKTLIGNKEKLSELARTPLNENCSAVILNKLPKKLGDPGRFLIPSDFVVVDFEPDPRVPLILGRCFLKTSHALIDVYEGEITLRVGKEAIIFNLIVSLLLEDGSNFTLKKIQTYQDPEGDILLLEEILNSEPPPSPKSRKQDWPGVRRSSQGLKSLKRASLGNSRYKGCVAQNFCTLKILMKRTTVPSVQGQRRGKPKNPRCYQEGG